MIKTSMLDHELYRSGEVAKILGVCSRTVHNYVNEGYLDNVSSGSERKWITRESLIRYLDSRRMLDDDLGRQYDLYYVKDDRMLPENRKDEPVVVTHDLESAVNHLLSGNVRSFLTDRMNRTEMRFVRLICSYHGTTIKTEGDR